MKRLISWLLALSVAGVFCLASTPVQAELPDATLNDLQSGYDFMKDITTGQPNDWSIWFMGADIDIMYDYITGIQTGYNYRKVQLDGGVWWPPFFMGFDIAETHSAALSTNIKLDNLQTIVDAQTIDIATLNAKLDTIIDLLTTPQGRRTGWNQ